MKKTVGSAIAAMFGGLALVMVGAVPANAATLPDGDILYVYAEDAGLFTSTDTGALTSVGGGADLGAWGADYDPVTGLAYFFDDDENPCDLYSLDLETGVETLIGPITDGVTEYANCDGFDISASGDIWLTGFPNELLRVSPVDASVLEVGNVTGMVDEIAFIATDPTTGILYAGDYDSDIYTIDTVTWAATLVADTDYIQSGDFDSVGTFWYQGAGVECQNGLYSFDPADVDGTALFQGDLLEGDSCIDAYAVFVGPEIEDEVEPVEPAAPTLPATGADGQWFMAAIAVLILGLGLAMRRTASVSVQR